MKKLNLVTLLLAAACGTTTDYVEPIDPDALACCECLASTADPLGDKCLGELLVDECTVDVKAGELPGAPRCYTGGGYCDVECAEIFWRNQ